MTEAQDSPTAASSNSSPARPTSSQSSRESRPSAQASSRRSIGFADQLNSQTRPAVERRASIRFALDRPLPDRRKSIQILEEEPHGPRRTSLQSTHRQSTSGDVSLGIGTVPTRRNASPPPALKYSKRISFDTFDNKDALDFSLTLKAKHDGYSYSNRSRTFLCGLDRNDYSINALEWLLDELVDDGDEVVCFQVIDKDSKINSDSNLEQGRYRQEAGELLELMKMKNRDDEKSISLILEFLVGKIHETIQRMIMLYEPSCLIVGTKGRPLGSIQSLLPGSVSKYCLQNSPVPVIVVRPWTKREKTKRKRQADPTRRNYQDLLELASTPNMHALNQINRHVRENQSVESDAEDEGREAAAVARALGISEHNIFPGREKAKLAKHTGDGFEQRYRDPKAETAVRSEEIPSPYSVSSTDDSPMSGQRLTDEISADYFESRNNLQAGRQSHPSEGTKTLDKVGKELKRPSSKLAVGSDII